MDAKHIIAFVVLAELGILIYRHRKLLALPAFIAFLTALTWTAYYPYKYVGENFLIFDRINVYPLILWTFGLTLLYFVYSRLPKIHRLPVIICLYYIFLALIEVIGYHYLSIRLQSNYTSLLGLGIIHAPFVMKVFYVAAGPIYIILVHAIAHSRIAKRLFR